jgi:tetratricopeptide (TPR) repeat protein
MATAKRLLRILAGGMVSCIPLLSGACRPSAHDGHRSAAESAADDTEGIRAWLLMPHPGSEPVDSLIRREQALLSAAPQAPLAWERLGFLFLAKARLGDVSHALRAGHCAALSAASGGDSSQALLIQGMAYQQSHRFRDAEAAARKLVRRRGLAQDLGLLGDALLDLGRTREAIDAYQKMLDRKPGSQAYARAAHVRWLRGDQAGAEEAMEMAARAATTRDREAAAWIRAQLALYRMRSGRFPEAEAACRASLALQSDYPPALFLQGRIRMALGRYREALAPLARAAASRPLAEYRWAWSEALREAGRPEAADSAAPRRGDPDARGLGLAEREASGRGDPFTLDALAWCLHATGRSAEAWPVMERALAEGTRDARLAFHAGAILQGCGRADEARRHLELAASLRHMLLPSEWRQVRKALGKPRPRGQRALAFR